LNKKISIITVNYNGLSDTCALIDSIPFDETMEVIVVDNASKNDEGTIIQTRYPQVRVIQSSENLGFAGGNNLGIKASTGDYLFFINNDTEFHPDDWNLQALVDRMDSSEHIGMVCPKIRFAWDSYPIQFAGYTPLSPITLRNRSIGFGEEDRGQYNTAHPTPYAHGAAMMVKREAIEKAGMMPECFFLYYEELDWSMMITRAGYDIWYEPACTIYHKESQATGQDSPLKTYYLMRNRLLLAKRNIPLPTRMLSYTYLIGIVGTKDIIKNIIKGRSQQAKATLKGIFDFIKL
jgi:hypothetical protein